MAGALVFDDIFQWEGWGGKLRLGSGSCRLRIYDLKKEKIKDLAYLRPIIVVVSDIPESKMSVRSCSGHIATSVARSFNIDYHRMLFVEYYPESLYGDKNQHVLPERCDAVDFTWQEDKAIKPKWRTMNPPLKDILLKLIREEPL
jgi:hypothetical protein